MALTSVKQFSRLWPLSVIIGLLTLAVILFRRSSNRPQEIIRRNLSRLNIPEQTIKYWIAVSAFETSGWTSRVFKDSNNLFNLIVPGSKRLPYGEGQTIYTDVNESVVQLYTRVMKPYQYPLSYNSLYDLVIVMKSKGYFTSGFDDYFAGVEMWYKKLFQ